ncbi:uroporphyrinogen-III synthase [Elioraea sp.]|uniref:uroporphyrinogen-III synthase n=1 Tax=Elioraea sp. TaxID=2185103 RepID=UPI00307DFA04
MADARAVLVTRPEPEARETARRLRALGYRPVLAPMLTITPVPARLPPPEAVQAIIAGSMNAVRALPAAYRRVPLLAVGDATAAAARAGGYRTVRSAAGDARDLAALAARLLDPRSGPLLLPTRAGEGLRLAADLRARGFAVLRRIVYAATPAAGLAERARAAFARGAVGAVVFFSASAARTFARIVRRGPVARMLGGVTALTISEAAAAALGDLAFRAVRVAARPDQDSLLALLSAGGRRGRRGERCR